METVRWILFFSVYIFAGVNIGQLTNLVDHERNQYTKDNRFWLSVLWLPVAIMALWEYWEMRKTLGSEEPPERNEIWERIQRDWASRDFNPPPNSYQYPWERASLDLPIGFDGGAGWAEFPRPLPGISSMPYIYGADPGSPSGDYDGSATGFKIAESYHPSSGMSHDPADFIRDRDPGTPAAFPTAPQYKPSSLEFEVVPTITPEGSIFGVTKTRFSQPFRVIEAPAPDPVEPAGNTLTSEPDLADDFI